MMNSMEKSEERIWTPAFITVFLANGMMYLGQWMCNSLIAKYTGYMGAGAVTIGFVSSAFAYTALLIKFVSAPVIDVFNKKWIAFISMAVMAFAFFGYSISGNIPTLIAFRLLQGCCQGFTATCCLALAADTLPSSRIGAGIGYFTLAQAICQAVGPTLGLNLVTRFGYRVTFMAAAVCTFTGAILALTIKNNFKKTRKFKLSLNSIIAKEALVPAVILFFFSLSYSNINAFLILYGEDRGMNTSEIGLFFTVYALALLVSRPMIGKMTDRLGFVKVLIPGMCMFAASFFIISIATNIPMLLTAALVNAFGFGASQPAVQALCMKLVPQERRGAGSSTSYLGNDGGQLLGPLVAGSVVESMGYSTMWRVMIIPIVAALATVIIFRNKINAVSE